MADPVAIATQMVQHCLAEDWDEAYALTDPIFSKSVTEFMSVEMWRRVRLVAGNFKSFGEARPYRHLLAPLRVVFLTCTFDRLKVEVEVDFNADNRIVGLALRTPGF